MIKRDASMLYSGSYCCFDTYYTPLPKHCQIEYNTKMH